MTAVKQKIVFITGASSGIGQACAEQFAVQGARLILAARRLDRLDSIANVLKNKYKIEVLTIKLDVQDKAQVIQSIESLPSNWSEIDILLNNAGLALGSDKIQEGHIEKWDTMIQTNVNGLLYVTRTILPGMVARNRGHIVNIGSIAGHQTYQGGNVYSATKHAVKAISRSLRVDLLGSAIRVSEIDPGAVETEFSIVRWKDEKRAKAFYSDFTPLVAYDIADAVLYCVTRPAHVNVSEMTIYPVDQASANHINKRGQVTKGMLE